jgi:hypothetical protein
LSKLLKKRAIGAVTILNNSHSLEEQAVHDPPKVVADLLLEFADIFQEPSQLPPFRTIDHTIQLQPNTPLVNQRAYRLPYHKKNAMETLIKQLLQDNMIRPSVSPYSSPIILVKKKDGSWRLCVDYRVLNSKIVKNEYPTPIVEDLLDELFGAKVFSKIYMRSGYHQIRMKEEDIHKTTFTTQMGHFEYVVIPFVLSNAPATFQALMNTMLAEVLRKFALVFFDDILIYNPSITDHVHHLRIVLQILRENQLFAKLTKCTFAQHEVEYLGHIINA